MARNRRSGVADTWTRHDGTPSKEAGRDNPRKRWRARYVDDLGREHSKSFDRKADAQRWMDTQTAAIVGGTHVAPRDSKIALSDWIDLWLEGYGKNRDSTVRQARTHIAHIKEGLGTAQLGAIKKHHIEKWLADLKADKYAPSYRAALFNRLAQILGDAVAADRLGRNPCRDVTSDSPTKREWIPTTAMVWQLHDAVPPHLRVAVLLGAFAGLRVSEAAGLRISDVNFTRGVVHPKQQWGGADLKTEGSDKPVPIPQEMALMLSASYAEFGGDMMVTNGCGQPCGPWLIQRAVAAARVSAGLPAQLTFHALRHHLASMLIDEGADVLKVQRAMRHAKASTTLDVYGHLWDSADDALREASARAFTRPVTQKNPRTL